MWSQAEERVVCADHSEPELRWQHGIPFRVIVGITCVLSMCGATLIIASYVFFKSLRNRARLILLHISIMDLGTVVSKFVGDAINFDRYYVTYPNSTCTIYHTTRLNYIQGLCEGQAFFSHFFTIGSVLWTISLSVYLYFLLVHYRTPYAQMSLNASYFLCYGLSLLVCVWLLLSNKLGYDGKSWCSIVSLDLLTGLPNRYAAVFGYDLWVYFTMTFVPVLYLTVHLYLRDKLKQSKRYLRDGEERFKEALTILDYWFFLIPLMFAVLRMWTCMVYLFKIYIQLKGVPYAIRVLMFYLSGVGDSAQGLVNGFLYVLFTKSVRKTVFSTVRCHRRQYRESSPSLTALAPGVSLNGSTAATSEWQGKDRAEIITPDPLTQSYQSI